MSGENEPGLTARPCEHCGKPIPDRRKDARYCSTSHRVMASRRRKRQAEIRESLVARGGQEFTDHSRPDHWDDPETEFSDEFDLLHEQDHQDDETGIVAGDTHVDPWAERNAAFRERMQLTEAVQAIETRYEHLLEPFRQSLKRNPGVKPVAIARLEQERDEKIRELRTRQQRAEALAQAAREAPQRAVRAAERQLEQAALNAFGRDLPGGSRRYQPPEWTGRPTDDIAVW